MKDITTLAISKAIGGKTKAAKAAREALTVGEHPISTMVHFDGVLKVEEDQMIAATSSLLNKDFLTLVLHHAGITRESALKAMSQVADTYLTDWQGTDEDKKAAKDMREAQVAKFDPEGKLSGILTKLTVTLPKIPRAGKCTFRGSVVEMAMPVLTAVETEASVA